MRWLATGGNNRSDDFHHSIAMFVDEFGVVGDRVESSDVEQHVSGDNSGSFAGEFAPADLFEEVDRLGHGLCTRWNNYMGGIEVFVNAL